MAPRVGTRLFLQATVRALDEREQLNLTNAGELMVSVACFRLVAATARACWDNAQVKLPGRRAALDIALFIKG